MNSKLPSLKALSATLIVALLLLSYCPAPSKGLSGHYHDQFNDVISFLDAMFNPSNREASFVVNDNILGYNRSKWIAVPSLTYPTYTEPTSFTFSTQANTRETDIERYLLTALKIANTHGGEDPNDTIILSLYLAGFYFRVGDFDLSEKYFKQAISLYEQLPKARKLRLAKMQDYLALAMRARNEYNNAEKAYKSSLEIRQRYLGREHPDVAKTYYNLAMLYNDEGKKEDQEMLMAAYGIVGSKLYLSPSLTPGARPFNIGSGNPSGNANLAKMVSTAQDIMFKYPPTPADFARLANKNAVGNASIIGSWQVPADSFSIKHRQDKLLGSIARLNTNKDQYANSSSNHLENMSVYLIPEYLADQLDNALADYAKKHDLANEDFAKKWPDSQQAAVEIVDLLDAEAKSNCKRRVITDGKGKFEFTSLPEGNYIVFASLCRGDLVLFWLTPTIELKANNTKQMVLSKDQASILFPLPKQP